MNRNEARGAASKTDEFIINQRARKLSMNGVFATERLGRGSHGRLYLPDYEDLLYVLQTLMKRKQKTGSEVIFKVGFEEEVSDTIMRAPFKSKKSPGEIFKRLRSFDGSQDIRDLL